MSRPPQELKAFAKVWLDPGTTTTVTLTLGDRAFSRWDPDLPGWRIDDGAYTLRIGRSSAELAHTVPVEVQRADD